MVESARAEHRGERDRVHPHREALEVAVGENDEERSGDDRGDERVLVKDTTKPRNVDVASSADDAESGLRLRNARFERRSERLAHRLELDAVEDVLEEAAHDQPLRLGAREPA